MSMDDLQEAIRLGRTAVDATPIDHPDRARQLNSLGVSFSVRYQRTGAIDDLHETIRLFQATVGATPEESPGPSKKVEQSWTWISWSIPEDGVNR